MTTPDTGFRFGGRLSLDLTWTLRYRAVAPTDLLSSPADLRRWVTAAVAPCSGAVTPADLHAALELREAVYSAALAVVEDRPVGRADRSVLNRWAARPAPFLRLDSSGRSVRVLQPGDEVVSALAVVALDAIELMSAADGRLRRCAGPGCALLFYDSSRPGRRRWCSTERCGNRVNTATYRRRQSDGTTNH